MDDLGTNGGINGAGDDVVVVYAALGADVGFDDDEGVVIADDGAWMYGGIEIMAIVAIGRRIDEFRIAAATTERVVEAVRQRRRGCLPRRRSSQCWR